MLQKSSYLVMGVSGSGKTTIGNLLAQEKDIPFYDADSFHPEENVTKMSAGIPLNDEDRWPWLRRISEEISKHEDGCVFACSALKDSYRALLSRGNNVKFIFLNASFDDILARMKSRTDHFMPPSLLRSQFETLEVPADAIEVDASLPVEEVMREILKQVQDDWIMGSG